MAKLKARKLARRPVRRPLNLCIITSCILEREAENENCAAVSAIAQHFAAAGDIVTLLWVPRPHEMDSIGEAEFAQLKCHYFEKFLIKLELLPKSPELPLKWWSKEKQSIAVYHHLRQSRFDSVYIVLEEGLGYYVLLAKETAVFQPRFKIHIIAQSPLEWLSEANKVLLKNEQQVA